MGDLFAHLAEDLTNIIGSASIRTTQVFLSYARKDNRQPPDYTTLRTDDPVTALYDKLTRMGFPVWRDLHDIYGSKGWWSQIQAAIKTSEVMVVCLSPHWLESEIARKERLYALQLGVPVLLVVIDDLPGTVPQWVLDEHYHEVRPHNPYHHNEWNKFIEALAHPAPQPKVVFMAADLAHDFVERPHEMTPLAEALVNNHAAVGITTAFHGAGGYGKTTLAIALCHQPTVREHFADGVLWLQLSEHIDDNGVIEQVRKAIVAMYPDAPAMSDLTEANRALKEAIGDRRILVVVDDAWSARALSPFLQLGSNSVTLVTTRNNAILPQHATRQVVDKMRQDEALQMLHYELPPPPDVLEAQRPALIGLAQRLGYWVLLLKLANKQLFKLVGRGKLLDQAIATVQDLLSEEGLEALDDPNNPTARYQSAAACIRVSLQFLDEQQAKCFAQLAIFPEDTDIPLSQLAKLWGGMKPTKVQRLIEAFADLSLLAQIDLGRDIIRLHDVVRQYLREQHSEQLVGWQTTYLEALGDFTSLSDDYTWRNLAFHLIDAGQADMLYGLLTDYAFLQAKLQATETNALLTDCAACAKALPSAPAPDTKADALRLLQSALGMSAHVLNAAPDQLPYQLAGRLWMQRDHPELARLWQAAHATPPLELIGEAAYPPLNAAGGALLATLAGHEAGVEGALETGAGRFLSWSWDHTLRLWAADGTPLATLRGHENWVNGALETGEGRFLSWSRDKTLRLWAADGTPLATLPDWERLAEADLRAWCQQHGVAARDLFKGTADDPAATLARHDDNRLRVWGVGDFIVDAGIQALAVQGHTIMVGDALGRVIFVRVRGR